MVKRARVAAPGEPQPKLERRLSASESDSDSDSNSDFGQDPQSGNSPSEVEVDAEAELSAEGDSDSNMGSDMDASDDDDALEDVKEKKDQFSGAMNAILGSKIKAHDRENPILIRNKKSAKDIEDARLELKAQHAMRQERESLKDKAHVKDVIPKDPDSAGEALQQEKKFRKTAQRGVVRLLNAIHASQSVSKDGALSGETGEDATSVSKERFLDMIRSG